MSRKLMSYLEGYEASPDMTAFQEGIQPEADLMWESRTDLLNQLNPKTATWGLDKWEEAYGIPIDTSKDAEYRRTRIVSKIRGNGTTTVELIRTVSESFSNGTVDVVELFGEYRVEVRFTGSIGIPPNMDDLADALNEVMPAHLAWEFIIYYRTHLMLAANTHEFLSAYTHEQLRNEVLG